MNTTFKGALQLGVARFSHLAGFGRVKAKGKAESDEDEKKKKDDEAAAAAAEDDDERMEDDERDESAEGNDGDAGDDDDEDEDDDARAEADGDDKDDEKDKDKDKDKDKSKKAAKARGIRVGRRMERKRIARILSSPAAAKNIALAVSLACETGISSTSVLATLKRTPAATGGGREARNPQIEAGGDDNRGGKPTAAQIDASWGNAFTKVGAMTARK